MLGLPDKGHLTPGADADIVIVDMNRQEAIVTMAGGNLIMINGIVTGKDGTIVTTETGRKKLIARGIPIVVSDLAHSLFYNAPEPINGR